MLWGHDVSLCYSLAVQAAFSSGCWLLGQEEDHVLISVLISGMFLLVTWYLYALRNNDLEMGPINPHLPMKLKI